MSAVSIAMLLISNDDANGGNICKGAQIGWAIIVTPEYFDHMLLFFQTLRMLCGRRARLLVMQGSLQPAACSGHNKRRSYECMCAIAVPADH